MLKCCNCGGDHSAAYGGCEKQKEARKAKRYKITHKVSYAEALKKIEKEKKDVRPDAPTCISEQSTSNSYSSRSNISRMNDRNHLKVRIQQVSRPCTPDSESCECTAKISEETLLVKKNYFIAFICTVINRTMQYPKKSDRIKSIVDIANYFLGFRTQADEIHEMLNLKYAQNPN